VWLGNWVRELIYPARMAFIALLLIPGQRPNGTTSTVIWTAVQVGNSERRTAWPRCSCGTSIGPSLTKRR